MSIFYYIWKVWLWSSHTHLKTKRKYVPEISTTKFVKGNQDIAEQLANEIDVNYNTLIYVINQYDRVTRGLLCEGFTVKTENLVLTPMILGEWEEQQLEYKPEKYKRTIDCQPTNKILQALEHIDVKVMGTKDTTAYISQIIDQKSGEINTCLSRNGEIIIRGNSIKAIAGDGSTNHCIYLINSDRTMIDIGGNNLIQNQSEEIILQLPNGIEKGKYYLSILTYFTDKSDTLLEQIRCIEFDKILYVK